MHAKENIEEIHENFSPLICFMTQLKLSQTHVPLWIIFQLKLIIITPIGWLMDCVRGNFSLGFAPYFGINHWKMDWIPQQFTAIVCLWNLSEALRNLIKHFALTFRVVLLIEIPRASLWREKNLHNFELCGILQLYSVAHRSGVSGKGYRRAWGWELLRQVQTRFVPSIAFGMEGFQSCVTIDFVWIF